jgi:hypothetical protein
MAGETPALQSLVANPGLDGFAHFAETAFEEVVRGFDDHEFLRFRQGGDKCYQLGF